MLNCQEASRLVSEGQDRHLRLAERINLRMHLWMCGNCQRFERQLKLLRAAFNQVSDSETKTSSSSRLPEQARERIRRRLAKQQSDSDNP